MSRVTRLRGIALISCVITVCIFSSVLGLAPVMAQDRLSSIHVIEVRGVINPLTARYLERGLAEAEQAGAEALIMRLDTPGGLDTAMREMTKAMLAARVPIVVYVAPSGARAASAGLFLTIAAHVAAMAPGTNIGAAHPVSIGEQLDEVMSNKVAQDAAATARTLAVERGRNAEWAEKAVLESVSLTSAEALECGLIEIIAVDMNDLLDQLDGREVTTSAGTVTLDTRAANVVNVPMNFAEQVLHVITDPNIAYLLLTLGLYALLIEFQAPGFGLPGAVGVIALVLAFVAFGNLPLNWAGIGLIALGVILMIVEATSPGLGALGVAGLIMFGLGSLMLYQPFEVPSPTLPAVAVNPWLVGVITVGTGALILVAVRKAWQAQRTPAISAVPQRTIGLIGSVTTDLAPLGTVQVGSELWTASAEGEELIRAGEKVEVSAVDGLVLIVRRETKISSMNPAGG
jgi:membrane-bound serine protease (ClpP class)